MSPKPGHDERVSLHGLNPVEALRALLRVNPGDEPKEADSGEGNQG